jgi:two-component system, chemotaxis family, sensor kinase Cph1
VRDPSEQRQVNRALGESTDCFRQLVDSVKDYAIYMLDLDGHIISWNSGAERIQGFRAEETIGTHFSRFYVDDDVAERQAELVLSTASQEGRYEHEGWRLCKDGSRFWANDLITAVRDPGGRLRGFARVIRDISGQRQAQEAFARRADELARSNRELEQFAYVASHDLQEPLRMVSSYVQLLERRYRNKLDANANEFIEFAVDGVRRMKTLLDDLLAYSRVRAQGKPFAPADVAAVLNDTLLGLKISIEEYGATVTHDPLPAVCGDATQLAQLFQNLIGNGLKFRSAQPPRIHISAHSREHEWVFSIRDNGIGIDPQYHERIFVIFQRLHSSGECAGNGIGLAICKRIVERHGGRIWVESQPGNGATFHFTIPMNVRGAS